MRKIFVTGANGFIGTHLCAHLLERGDEVIGMVRETSDISALAPLFREHGDQLRLVVGDLRDPDSLDGALHEVDYVYHLAAVVMGTSEEEFRASNVEGTRNLLDVLERDRKPEFRRLLFTSSLAAAGPSPDGSPIDESHPPRPVSWYGASKRDAELLVVERAATLPVTVIRPVAVYGERERDISRGTFPAVKAGLSPRIGLGAKTVSVIYVGDLVDGMIAAAESENTRGRTYFLADAKAYKQSEFIGAMADAMGRTIRIPLFTPPIAIRAGAVAAELAHKFTRGRPVLTRDKAREITQKDWVCTPEAARRDFGWQSREPLDSGIAREVRDWEERKDALRRTERLPQKDRAIQTYCIALLIGILLEGTAYLAGWYRFDPEWLIVVIVLGVFGGVMGTLSLLTARSPWWVQFVAGAAVGIGAELLNWFVLHAWSFDPDTFGRIPGPWLLALALGLPAGLMPILVNAGVRALYKRRLRLG